MLLFLIFPLNFSEMGLCLPQMDKKCFEKKRKIFQEFLATAKLRSAIVLLYHCNFIAMCADVVLCKY